MRMPNVRLGFCSRLGRYWIGPSLFKSKPIRLCYSSEGRMCSAIYQLERKRIISYILVRNSRLINYALKKQKYIRAKCERIQ